jgi:hypothetical protein
MADTVVYKNASVGSYDSYSWNFGAGANPQTATTSSATDSFKVVYSTPGMKKIVLKAVSGTTTDSIVNGNAVEIFDGVPLLIHTTTHCSTILKNKQVILVPKGADSYHWYANTYISESTGTSPLTFTIGEASDKFKVTGTLGTCTATDSVTLYPIDTLALYDDIQNAYTLTVGTKEGPFSNECATWLKNEPIAPEGSSCTAQNGWCSGENVLHATLWFKFVAPSDSVKIFTSGIDNKIALYDAISTGTYADIISGNSSKYTLLAANDDSSDTQSCAYIKPIKLTAGKTYWLQLDASLGGIIEGNSYITVQGVTTAINTTSTDEPRVLNPVKDGILQIEKAQNITSVELFDLQGRLLQSVENQSSSVISIRVNGLPAAYYIVKMHLDKTILSQKVLVQ